VFAGIIFSRDVIDLHHPGLISIEDLQEQIGETYSREEKEMRGHRNLKCLQDKLLSALIELSSDPNEEFIKRNLTGFVLVKVVEEDFDLLWGPGEGMLFHSLRKLFQVDALAIIVVHNLKFTR
jgi:hypothetical protein